MTMKVRLLLIISLLLQMGNAYSLPLPKEVIIFTNKAFPIEHLDSLLKHNIAYQVINLDSVSSFLREIEQKLDLNHGEVDATRKLQAYLASNEGRFFTTDLKALTNDVVKAYSMGIQKLPAIVFDHQSVGYGVTDIQKALALYARQQEGGQP